MENPVIRNFTLNDLPYINGILTTCNLKDSMVGLFGSCLYKNEEEFKSGSDYDCFIIIPEEKYAEAHKIYETICGSREIQWKYLSDKKPYILYEQVASRQKGYLCSIYLMTMDVIDFVFQRSFDFAKTELILKYYRYTPRKRAPVFPTYTYERFNYDYPLNPHYIRELNLWEQDMPSIFSKGAELYIGVFIEHFLTAVYFGNNKLTERVKSKIRGIISNYKKEFFYRTGIDCDAAVLLHHLNVYDTITDDYKKKLIHQLRFYIDD